MTALSQTILENYQVRKTKKQKLAFISLLKEHFPQLQVQEGGFPKSRNLVFGDIESAKVIISAHYDTCARLPFPNFITPRSPLLSFLYSFVPFIPVFTVVFLLNMVLNLLTENLWIHYTVSLIACFGLLSLMFFGPANKHNANDNTSGVIALCELMGTLSEAERGKAAFVFFDNEEIGLLGSSLFRSKHKKQLDGKLLLNFDCIADGDYILVAATKKAREELGQSIDSSFQPKNGKTVLISKVEKIYYPSDQAGFKKSIVVAALHRKNGIGYYLGKIHTHRDTAFDHANISLICNCTLRLLKKL